MSDRRNSDRLAYIDVLRAAALFAVLYGHLFAVAGGASSLPGVINASVPMPFFVADQHWLWMIDKTLIVQAGAQLAPIGVALFFVATGYLMPSMLERYSRIEFGINRAFRILPTLWAALIVVAIVAWLAQGISYTPKQFLTSATLTYIYFGVVPIEGVLWTLCVETAIYVLMFICGRMTVGKLFALQAAVVVVLLSIEFLPAGAITNAIWYQAPFVLLALIGSAIFLGEREPEVATPLLVFSGGLAWVAANYFLVRTGTVVGDYNHISVVVAPLVIFLLARELVRLPVGQRVAQSLRPLADLVYPAYLVHLIVGLAVIAALKDLTAVSVSATLVVALAAVFAVSVVLHGLIERPSIALGRRVLSWLPQSRPASLADATAKALPPSVIHSNPWPSSRSAPVPVWLETGLRKDGEELHGQLIAVPPNRDA